jgi:hypothetical protein
MTDSVKTPPPRPEPASVRVGGKDIPVWPENQRIDFVDRYVQMTVFEDWPDYHGALIARALELEAIKWGDDRPDSRTLGGRKVHHLDQWECPAADLINARAAHLFRLIVNDRRAHMDLSWANVYRQWDYVVPHSHRMSVASLTYFLDPGEEDLVDPRSGRLAFADPRLDICCGEQPGYVTTQCYVEPVPGTMLIWPSPFVHFVTPYAGTSRPRITLAWNFSRFRGEQWPEGESYPAVPPTPTSRA